MGLSCHCDTDGDYWCASPKDHTTLDTKRWRKCCSCGKRLEVGEEVAEFANFRSANSDYEEHRFPDGVPLASAYMCPSCHEMAENLGAAGYCITLGESMPALMKEYWERTGFNPDKYKESVCSA